MFEWFKYKNTANVKCVFMFCVIRVIKELYLAIYGFITFIDNCLYFSGE